MPSSSDRASEGVLCGDVHAQHLAFQTDLPRAPHPTGKTPHPRPRHPEPSTPGPHLPATCGLPPAPGRLLRERPGGAASWRVRARGPTTGTAPSAPGPRARGPAASGDAVWRLREGAPARKEARRAGSAGSWELLRKEWHSGCPGAEFPFPGPSGPHPHQTPVTTGGSHWPEPRASWERTGTGSFPQSQARYPGCRRLGGGAGPGQSPAQTRHGVGRPELKPSPRGPAAWLWASRVTWREDGGHGPSSARQRPRMLNHETHCA